MQPMVEKKCICEIVERLNLLAAKYGESELLIVAGELTAYLDNHPELLGSS